MLLMAATMLLCMAAGLAVSRLLPWSATARGTGMPLTTGLSLGPFLFGFAGMLVLGVLPGLSYATHLTAGLAGVAVLALAAWWASRRRPAGAGHARAAPFSAGEWLFVIALVLVAAALLFVTLFVPLTQNDSLEYAAVGRELFRTRTLATYPLLDPQTNASGFFGPWTHPPLYVAAIYVAEIIQGHADAPGAMRLISPWFAITGAGVVFSVGAIVGRAIGLASALVFLSTPLLFLGAGSALLDALYVSGFALLVAAIAGIEARPVTRGAMVGAAIGLVLWTHSAAILFVPLGLAGIVLWRGLANPRQLARELAAAIVVALLLGGWPYVRNVALFGTPISDNPAVFALPSLHWDDYFVINRGLDTPVAMIQYGILKGWFAFEAFGVTFWGMAAGFVLLVLQRGLRPAWESVWRGASTLQPPGILYVVFGLLAVYLAGAIVSVLLGLDIMVKNERYLLSIQALVALGAGYGYVRLVESIAGLFRNRLVHAVRLLGCAALGVVLLGQSVIFVQYALGKNGLGFTHFGAPFAQTLANVPDYQLTEYLRTQTPADALVLSLKPADMYYADRKMVSYLDPRMIEFYAESDPSAALERLKALGVGFVHVPNYGIPPLYNSELWQILCNPAMSDVLFTSNGGQVYALSPSKLESTGSINISPGSWPWTRETVFILGGRKRIGQISSSRGAFDESTSVVELPLGLFQRNMLTQLSSESGKADGSDLIPVPKGAVEVAVDLALTGRGLVSLRIVEYGPIRGPEPPTVINQIPLTTFELTEGQGERIYGHRVRLSPSTNRLAIIMEQQGESVIAIHRAAVSYWKATEDSR